jgi:hypothetical protein
MPNSKIIVLETTVAYIKFLKDCDPSQLLAIAKNSSNLVPSGVDPAIIPKVINSTTMESFNYTVLEKIYSPDFDMSILDTKTYIFDDETGFIGKVPISHNLKELAENLPIIFLDTYSYLGELPNNIETNSSHISDSIDHLDTKIDNFCINNHKSATIIAGMVGSYAITHVQPIEKLIVMINGSS